jgi:hypothetical protein
MSVNNERLTSIYLPGNYSSLNLTRVFIGGGGEELPSLPLVALLSETRTFIKQISQPYYSPTSHRHLTLYPYTEEVEQRAVLKMASRKRLSGRL